jgi:hypothetical protein
MTRGQATTGPATLTFRGIGEAPVAAGAESPGPFLIAPDRIGGWALAAWDGKHWYDLVSGQFLAPGVFAALPDPAAVMAIVAPGGV